MKETELGKAIVSYFAAPHHEIFCEVQCQGIIDVVVKNGNILTAIECKTTFGLAVIEQAIKNKRYAHYSFVAVPKVSSSFAKQICNDYGIGILIVPNSEWGNVRVQAKPKLNRRIMTPKLHEFQKGNVAGVQSGRETAWGHFVKDVKYRLGKDNGMSAKQLFDECFRYYHSPENLKSNLYQYIRNGLIKGVEYRKGLFYLSK